MIAQDSSSFGHLHTWSSKQDGILIGGVSTKATIAMNV